jgi:hypothetical protein
LVITGLFQEEDFQLKRVRDKAKEILFTLLMMETDDLLKEMYQEQIHHLREYTRAKQKAITLPRSRYRK